MLDGGRIDTSDVGRMVSPSVSYLFRQPPLAQYASTRASIASRSETIRLTIAHVYEVGSQTRNKAAWNAGLQGTGGANIKRKLSIDMLKSFLLTATPTGSHRTRARRQKA